MNRCVIVAGADILNYEEIKKYLLKDDFYIFCDCGLKHRSALGVKPGLIVGDFDSFEKPREDTEIIALPCEKDDTDTVFAVKEAVRRGFKSFLILGAVGQRLDHTLGNVSILKMLFDMGINAVIADDYTELSAVGREPVEVGDEYPYFSLINIFGPARGITVENAKYPLDCGEISCDYQYGISNEVLKGKKARISVESGTLLLVKVK